MIIDGFVAHRAKEEKKLKANEEERSSVWEVLCMIIILKLFIIITIATTPNFYIFFGKNPSIK